MAKEKKKKGDLWYDIIKPFGKKVAKGAKKMGVGVGKEEWKKGEPERKAKRKASKEKAAKKRAENKARAKKAPVYSSKKDYSKAGAPKKAEAKKAEAKKKEGKTWTKAVKKQKKVGGSSMNELIKARNAAKASGDKSAYAAAQNQINKAYGSKKVHKADAPKKAEKKKVAAKPDVRKMVKNLAKSKPKAKVDVKDRVKAVDKKMSSERWASMSSEEQGAWKDRHRGGATKMAGGGKVEGNPYGWPSKDSRKR